MRDKRDRILIDGGISWQTDKLLERFPIQNTSEWEVDKTSNRYPMIVSKIAEPNVILGIVLLYLGILIKVTAINMDGHVVQWILRIIHIFVIQQSIKSQSSYGKRRSKRS